MNDDKKINAHNPKVCIVGLGPAGIGAALTFSKHNLASNVLCLDAGPPPNSRSCLILQKGYCKKDNPCQMISGFGGCSLIGGGKISLLPAGKTLTTILGSENFANKKLSEAFTLFSNYLPLQKPNITLNNINQEKEFFEKLGFQYKYYDAYIFDQIELRKAYQKILQELESAKIKCLLNTQVEEITHSENGFKLIAKHKNRKITIFSEYLILGMGRLGLNMLRSLNSKLNLCGEENHLDVGVRLEFPNDLYENMNIYHNDLKLLFTDARTFCVCRNGKIAPYRFEDMFFTEGYYDSRYKSGFTNLGILVRLRPSKQNRTIFEEIKKRIYQISNGELVYQRLSDYLDIPVVSGKPIEFLKTSISFGIMDDVNQCFPSYISTKIKDAVFYFVDRLLPKNRLNEVTVFAPEVNYGGLSFPIKPDFSIIPKLYLIGDCTGKFRGILQSFCSGIICAESIIGDNNEKNQ